MIIRDESEIQRIIGALKIAKHVLYDEIARTNINENTELENLLMETDMYIGKAINKLERAKVIE